MKNCNNLKIVPGTQHHINIFYYLCADREMQCLPPSLPPSFFLSDKQGRTTSQKLPSSYPLHPIGQDCITCMSVQSCKESWESELLVCCGTPGSASKEVWKGQSGERNDCYKFNERQLPKSLSLAIKKKLESLSFSHKKILLALQGSLSNIPPSRRPNLISTPITVFFSVLNTLNQ